MGVLDRLITHLLIWSVHVSLEFEGGNLGAGMGAEVVLVEGVGAMGVAGTAELLEVWVEVLEKLDGTFWHLLKVFCLLMFLIFGVYLEGL